MRVLVAVPNDGSVSHLVTAALLKLKANPCGHDVDVSLHRSRPVDNCRNQVVKFFLQHDYDYMLFLDSDNPPMADVNPLGLVDEGLDVVVCPTPMYRGDYVAVGRCPIQWNVFDDHGVSSEWVEASHKGEPIQKIDAGGTGCMLIRRAVLESVRPAFAREYDEHGIIERGSDLLFCRKATDAGFSVHVAWDYPCHHLKEVDLLQVRQSMWERDIAHASSPNINTPEYWDHEWAQRGERVLPFYDWIAKRALSCGPRILDYGCGRGDLLAMLGPEARGLDISRRAVEQCRSRGLRANRITTTGNGLRGPFDAAVATEVLEHVDDDVALLRQLLSAAPVVFFSVPNDCMPPGQEPEHRRVYTPASIERRLRSVTKILEWDHWLVCVAERKVSSEEAGKESASADAETTCGSF